MVKIKRLYKTFMILTAMLVVIMLLLTSSALNAATPNQVIVANLSGTVSVQMEEFVSRVITQAENERAALIVFELNTPGGLVSVTSSITQMILNSRVPVVMWVPPGGSATSAGAFIMQSAHIAAMSPGTTMGAASPVIASGQDVPEGDARQKIMNSLLSQMRSYTQVHGRNESVAQRMIEESLSLTALEALQENAIDIMVNDINALLYATNGRIVSIRGQQTAIEVSPSASVERVEMTFPERFIQFLSSPDIAFLLLSGGLLAIFYEIITPGSFILGTTGVVMLLLGGIGLRMLPFNWAGVALIGAGVIIMGLEIMTGGTGGLLGLLGTGAMITGGMFLFRAPDSELLNQSIGTIFGISITLGVTFTIIAILIAKSLRAKIKTGREGLVGFDVEIIEDLSPAGMVKCRGEMWKARTTGETLRKGYPAIVASTDGITLIVKTK